MIRLCLQRPNVQKCEKEEEKKEIEHLSLKGTFQPFRLKIKLILQRMNSIDESIILHALSNFGSIYYLIVYLALGTIHTSNFNFHLSKLQNW